MIGPVAGISNAYAATKPASTGNIADALNYLTPQDWNVVSAAVGHPLQKSPPGQAMHAQPLLLWMIGIDRKSGKIPAGQPVTAQWFQGLDPGKNQGLADDIQRAITWLQTRSGETSSKTSSTIASTLDMLV